MIVISDDMADKMFNAYELHPIESGSMRAALDCLTAEEKRELASQLLRSANTDEGYSEDTA
jgi:hypothetical protein